MDFSTILPTFAYTKIVKIILKCKNWPPHDFNLYVTYVLCVLFCDGLITALAGMITVSVAFLLKVFFFVYEEVWFYIDKLGLCFLC